MVTSLDIQDFVVVGGGAAGFFAAIVCAEQAIHLGKTRPRILILERGNHPLGKVLISGGGRCNLTHACFDPAQLATYYPRGGAALRGAFTRFQPQDTLRWFEEHGVALKTEADGRIFPVTDSSQTIVDCLLVAARQARVSLWSRARVKAIECNPQAEARFCLQLVPSNPVDDSPDRHTTLLARRVLLATGGDDRSLRLAESLGHAIEPPVPSLFTFNIPDARLEGLAGISLDTVCLRLRNSDLSAPALGTTQLPGLGGRLVQAGPVLITHWGLSGPAVLRLSAWGARWLHDCNYQAALEINWLHPQLAEEVFSTLLTFKTVQSNARRKVVGQNPFQRLPQRLWERLALAAGVLEQQNWADLSRPVLLCLAQELTRGIYTIRGKGLFKEEFVTCGGVSLETVNFRSMESRLAPGLYFAGEVLDVDGLTGGFNFQNAWTTGWLAGMAVAASLGSASG